MAKTPDKTPPKENQPAPKAQPWKTADPVKPAGQAPLRDDLDRVARGLPPAGVTGQMPGPEPVPTPEPETPAPKPVKHPPAKEVAPGIFYLEHRKIYHADLITSGKALNVGNFDTLEKAQAAQAKAKADLNL